MYKQAISKGENKWMNKKFNEEVAEDKIQQEIIDEVLNENAHTHQWKWQKYLAKMLHFNPLQIVLLLLALTDVIVVLIEILINLNIYQIERNEAHDALNMTMGRLNGALHKKHKYLDEVLEDVEEELKEKSQDDSMHSDPEHLIAPYSAYTNGNQIDGFLMREKRSVSEGGGGNFNIGLHHSDLIDTLHATERILNIVSIVILGIFVVFVFLEMLVEGWHFFKKIMKIIDSVVTILSFILDNIKLSKILPTNVMDTIIVILLLWQIVRMFNGIMLSEIKRLEFRIKLQRRARKKLDIKCKEVQDDKKLLETEVESLQNLGRRKGLSEEDITMCHPVKISVKPSATAGLSMIAMMTMGMNVQDEIKIDKKGCMKHAQKLGQNLQIAPLSASARSSLRKSCEAKDPLEQSDSFGTESMTKNKSEAPSTDEGYPSEPPFSSLRLPTFDGTGKVGEQDHNDPFRGCESKDCDNVEKIMDNESCPIYVYKPLWKDENDERYDDGDDDVERQAHNNDIEYDSDDARGYDNDAVDYNNDNKYGDGYDDEDNEGDKNKDDENQTKHFYGFDNPVFQNLPRNDDDIPQLQPPILYLQQ